MVLSPRGAVLGRLKVLATTIWSPAAGRPPPKEPPPDETKRLLDEDWAARAAAADAEYLARLERFLRGREPAASAGEDRPGPAGDEAPKPQKKLYEVEEEGLGEAFLDAYEPSAKEKAMAKPPEEKADPGAAAREEGLSLLDECLGRLQFRDARAVAKKLVRLDFLSSQEADVRMAKGFLMGERFTEACSEMERLVNRQDEIGFQAARVYAEAVAFRSGKVQAVEFLDGVMTKRRKDWPSDRIRELTALRERLVAPRDF